MANPRQRRKAKSSTHKAISHSKRARRLLKKMPAIRGPKALQDAWDPSKTLRQNYSALGLAQNLSPISSGGSEVNASRVADRINTNHPHPTSTNNEAPSISGESSVTSALPKGFGRIIRDLSGNVVSVELPSDEMESNQNLVIEAPVKMTESELQIWAQDRPATWQTSSGMNGTIVQDLENLATRGTAHERHISLGERLYLERLIKKHGEDLDKMARDRRLNSAQRTASELRKAIAKAGGFGALCTCTGTSVSE